jgi:hypothetical protein
MHLRQSSKVVPAPDPASGRHLLERPLELFLALCDARRLRGFLEALVLLGRRQLRCLALGHGCAGLFALGESAVSEALDGLGPAELQRLASAMIAKGAKRPKNDQDLVSRLSIALK